MNSDCVQVLRRVAWTLIVAGLPTGMAMAASNNCAGLQPLPSTVEVGEGQQTIMHSPLPLPDWPWATRKLPMCISMGEIHTC